MKKIDILYKELDSLVLLRSEYLSSCREFYKNELEQINDRICDLHSIIYPLYEKQKQQKQKFSDDELYNIGGHF